MAVPTFETRSHWPWMTPLMVLCILPLLLDVSLGQSSCGSGLYCPQGQCCNNNYLCGNGTEFCSSANCSSQCPKQGTIRCGPSYNNTLCLDGSCCSIYGWCGEGSAWCDEGLCSSQCPSGTCGANNDTCQPGYCCNHSGFCGNTPAFCDVNSCASQCPLPSPSPAPSPAPILAPVSEGPFPIRSESGESKLGVIVGTSVGALAFLAVCVLIAFFVRRFRSKGLADEDPSMELMEMPERFSYKQLSVATRGFSPESKLGQGGFGSVYRGVLPSSGIPVAVKKISSDSNQGEKEFRAEISIISRLRHRNLIQLQGWCKDMAREKYLLVYELMPNGSLDKILFEPENQTDCLSWPKRFNIVTGTAAAVDYLHQGWKQQVIHRDIKSSNIMLDEDWNAKLGDFGLARLVDHQRVGATTVVAGTYGYIAPEAATTGRFTDKTDVYAFGAVLLEIACGRRAFSPELPPEEIVLVDWVWERLSQDALLSTVDKRLEDYDRYWMEVVLIIGLLCSHPDPEARPSMQHVVEVLAGHVPVPTIQASKPAPVYSSGSQKLFNIQPPKLESSSRSRSGSISLVSTYTSDSTRESTMKSSGNFSNSSASISKKLAEWSHTSY